MLVRMRKNHGYAKRGQVVRLEESIADFVLRHSKWTTQPVELPAEEKPVESQKKEGVKNEPKHDILSRTRSANPVSTDANKIVPPEVQPITLLEAKQHLRVDITEDDALIERLIEVATDYAETYCDMTFMMCKYRMKFDAFPYTIRLPRPPANAGLLKIAGGSVEIKYQPSSCDQELVVLDPSHYRYDYDTKPGCIYFGCNDGWPSNANMGANAVEVDWWAGFGPSPSDVPPKIKHGI